MPFGTPKHPQERSNEENLRLFRISVIINDGTFRLHLESIHLFLLVMMIKEYRKFKFKFLRLFAYECIY